MLTLFKHLTRSLIISQISMWNDLMIIKYIINPDSKLIKITKSERINQRSSIISLVYKVRFLRTCLSST